MPTADRYHQYEVLRRNDGSLWELGRGAMGITFKAFDTNLRFPVALKVINSAYLESETARQRFLREARAAAALRHPNVASVFNLGIEEDRYYYVMEFIDGETVEARVRRQGPLEPVEALNIGLQVTRALVVAAKQQLVHRDIKPSNLMLVSQEGEQIVKVIDFGLAKGPRDTGDDSCALTVAGFVGTPHFASPEQVEEQEVDIRSDIYSLGVTLYFILTGQSPFSGSAGQVMSQQLYKPLPIEVLAKLPRCVVSLIQQMTEKDRNNRPQTPQDLQAALSTCLEELGAARRVSGYPASDSAGAFETLDLSSTSGQPLGVGAVLARNYKLTEELAESPVGRSYLADDLAHKRQVNIIILSPDFLSDGRRLTGLEEAVRLASASPHPLLREIHSLETVTDCTFLVQEHITGPSLLDILRARSILTAPEVVRLVSLLAPLVDHANRHRLQHIDIRLPGIHPIDRASSSVGVRPDPLRRLLTSWEFLKLKVDAINLLSLSSNVETWSSPATLTQGAPGGAPESGMRLLSMLAYELLGGPRARLETTGQYTPLAALTQEGNAVLRQAVADEFPSAEEFFRQLAGATSAATSAPDVSDRTKQPPQTGDSRIPPPQAPVTVADQRKPWPGKYRWILILCPIVLLGIGFYLLSLFRGSQEIPTLSIRTDPANVAIFLDGKPPDIFPDTFTRVPFGTHELRALLSNQEVVTKEIQVQKGTGAEMRLQLTESQALPSLSVRTEPAGASILLDGKPPESSANNFTHVPFGTHRLSATLPDYYPIREEVQIRKGMAPEIRLQLKPIEEIAALSIITEPPGAAILLDGKTPQSSPNTFTHVPFGAHQLTAALADYVPLKQEIQVRKGMVPQIHLQLTPKQELDTLSVVTEPAGASILLDGKPPPEPPDKFNHVPFGTHQLTATLADYEPFRQEIQVQKGTAPQIHLQLTPKEELDTLSVTAEPAGALILLDGKPPQETPNTFTHVPFGTHQLTASLENYQTLKQEIHVKKGLASQIRLQLNPERELAALSIATEPAGASIFLDGKPPQSPPDTFTHVPFGTHQLIATLNKHQPIKRDLDVRQGMTGKINIELTPSSPDDIEWMSSLDPRGLEKAHKEFTEALEIYREMADKNPASYRPEVAKALNNLAILDDRQGRMEEARQEFAQALQIYRELTQKNQEIYWPLVATTLNNLANANMSQGRLEEARKQFVEALQIRRELAKKTPDTFGPFVAKTLNNLAILDRRQNRIEEARNEFEEALQIYRGLVQKNKEINAPFVAMALSNLANLALGQGRLEDARKEFAEALQIRRELTQKNPDVYRPYTAATLNNLAITDSHLNRWEDARKEFAEALDIYRELAQKNEATYRSSLATTLNYLGDVDLHQGHREDARKEYMEALQVYEILAGQEPGQFTPKVTHLKQVLEQLPGSRKDSGKMRNER